MDPIDLKDEVRAALEMPGPGYLMPLVCERPVEGEAVQRIRTMAAGDLFPATRSARGALAGLWLYLRCFDECHEAAQELHTPEGKYWHGILHRQEPDDSNSAYWLRAAGRHAIHDRLAEEASRLASEWPDSGWTAAPAWDPERFIRFCAAARRDQRPAAVRLARGIQQAEWRLLFDWCVCVRG